MVPPGRALYIWVGITGRSAADGAALALSQRFICIRVNCFRWTVDEERRIDRLYAQRPIQRKDRAELRKRVISGTSSPVSLANPYSALSAGFIVQVDPNDGETNS